MISIIIPNWNGKEFLEKCIPSVIRAVGIYGNHCSITVVDNNSDDGSVDYLRLEFPCVKISALKNNLGFSKAMNIGVREQKCDIFIGLNNDVIVEDDFITPLVRHFHMNQNIFAVAARMLLWDKKTLNFGRAISDFKLGIFRRKFDEPISSVNTLYACGGAFAADREKFLQLGGFDEDIFAFWEDLDLCYRAWKMGYRVVYEPGSVVYHKFHGTFLKKYKNNEIEQISGESYFLFILKNFHQKKIFLQQLFLLPFFLLIAPLIGKGYFVRGLLRSIKKWPLFLRKRKIEKRRAVFFDKQVLRMAK